MDKIVRYFPNLPDKAFRKLERLKEIYKYWNEKINLISRKDFDHFNERHLLHSLSIYAHFNFKPETKILDVGTGGGFPGIPLAIVYPDCEFMLVDSIKKKTNVVIEVSKTLNLKNVIVKQSRVENLNCKFDFIVSRAVKNLPGFVHLTENLILEKQINDFPNGIIYLKGGDFSDELRLLKSWNHCVIDLCDTFEEHFFKTKKIVYLSKLSISDSFPVRF